MTIALHFARTSRLLLTTGLLLAAVGLTAARFWLLPQVDAYRQSLQTRLSQSMGQPLRVGGLSAHMRGFYPELVLNDVAVVDAASGAINVWLGQVYVGLDLPHWFSTGELRTGWIALQGADLALQRRADGEIVLEGVRASAGGMPPWLFGYGRFELLNCKLRWSDAAGGPNLDVARADLLIVNNGDHHHVAANLALAGGEHLHVVADLDGAMQRSSELVGRVYAQGQQIRMETWPLPSFSGYTLHSGGANFRLWADWRDGRLQELAGWLALVQPQVNHHSASVADCFPHQPESCFAGTDTPLALAAVDGWFRWRRAETGWSLQTTQLRLNLNGSLWPASRISLAYNPAKLMAAADYIQLDDLAALLHMLAPTLSLAGLDTLDNLNLRGELRDLNLTYDLGADEHSRYSLCATFKDFGLNAHEALPGLTGLTGKLCGNDREAVVDIAAGPGAVDLPRLFRAPLPYTKAEGRLHWRSNEHAWTMNGEKLRLQTPDGALTSHFRLSQRRGDTTPLLDWQAHVEGGDLVGVPHYLPTHIMSDGSVAWLDAAFLGGRIVAADVLLRGPLAAYPFLDGEGVFQAKVEVADAQLHFAEGWPPLTGFSAQALFERDSLEISNGQGWLGAAVASDMVVSIDHMGPDGVLSIAGRVDGGLPQVMDFFAQSPRAPLIETIRAHGEAEGHAAIDLLLGLAFNDPNEEMDVLGETRITEGKLRLTQTNVLLDAISGSVQFHNGQIKADNLPAQVLAAPASLSLNSDGAQLRVSVSGRTTVQALHEQFVGGAAPEGINGKMPYKTELIIPQDFSASSQGLKLDFSGDLANVTVDLPPPFAKTVATPGFVRLNIDWEDKGGLVVRGDYSGLAKLQTRLSKASDNRWAAEAGTDLRNPLPQGEGAHLLKPTTLAAEAGELVLGDMALSKQMPTQGWRLAGRLAAVPLDVWWQRLTAFPQALSYGAKIQQVDLAVTQPSWEGRDWEAVAVNLSRTADGWNGRWESSFAVGNVRLPPSWPSNIPLALDLERLVLPKMPKETLERARQAQLDPSQLPTMTVHSQHLLWQGHNLGQFDCAVERRETASDTGNSRNPHPNPSPAGRGAFTAEGLNSTGSEPGLRLKGCNLTGELQQTGLNGEWWRANDKDFSRLNGKIKIKDLGKLLEHLGLGDEVVNTPAKLKFALQWQDAPQRVALSKLNGDMAVSLGQGSLRHVDPGLGRALGLFNIETLKRRLLLDFSDVFEEGLAYDKVRGEFKITDGSAETHNLLIDGPSARVFVSGKADIANRTLDEQITVMPRTSLAWPIVGTLAGGPAVGAAALLAQQLLGEKLDGFTASQYAISGGWDNPKVEELSHNMPLEVLLRVWQGVKDFSGFNDAEGGNE